MYLFPQDNTTEKALNPRSQPLGPIGPSNKSNLAEYTHANRTPYRNMAVLSVTRWGNVEVVTEPRHMRLWQSLFGGCHDDGQVTS